MANSDDRYEMLRDLSKLSWVVCGARFAFEAPPARIFLPRRCPVPSAGGRGRTLRQHCRFLGEGDGWSLPVTREP